MALNTPARTLTGHRPKAARVHALARRDERIERAVALTSVLIPTLGALAAAVAALAWGLGWTEILLWAVGHALTAAGVAIGYHRLVTHRAFETRRGITALFVILGSMSVQGPILWWAAIHRRHHATSEKPDDPHSPYVKDDRTFGRLRGFWHAHMGWLFLHESTDWTHYMPDLVRDRLLFRLNALYLVWVWLGLAIPAAIGAAVHGTVQGALLGLLWGGLLRVFTVQHATWCINSVCHMFGARPFECREEARNNLLIVLPTMGEGWHNHHHTFPHTAINQFEWWQFDPSGWIIRMLQAAGLAWNVRFPSREGRENHRRELLTRATQSRGVVG